MNAASRWPEPTRQNEVTEQTIYRWKAKYGNIRGQVSPGLLKEENARLKTKTRGKVREKSHFCELQRLAKTVTFLQKSLIFL